MGYTHYWEFRVPKGIKAADLEKSYQQAIADIGKIARVYNKECTKKGELGSRLSGYTAHVGKNAYGGAAINGKGENSHEDFSLREHFKQNLENAFNFCKTARKPYDIVIVACLVILKHRLGNAIIISSDGNASNWIAGTELAKRLTGLKIKNPID